jgi:hypothetical protein
VHAAFDRVLDALADQLARWLSSWTSSEATSSSFASFRMRWRYTRSHVATVVIFIIASARNLFVDLVVLRDISVIMAVTYPL